MDGASAVISESWDPANPPAWRHVAPGSSPDDRGTAVLRKGTPRRQPPGPLPCDPTGRVPTAPALMGPALRPPHVGPALRPPHEGPALRPPQVGPALRPPHVGPALRPPHRAPAAPLATLRAEARRLGLGEPTVARLLTVARNQGPRSVREALFCVALAITRHPHLPCRSRDLVVREWLALSQRPGAQKAWAELTAQAGFWTALEDEHRHAVARLLRRAPAPPELTRRGLEWLLGQPRFLRSGAPEKREALRRLAEPPETTGAALLPSLQRRDPGR